MELNVKEVANELLLNERTVYYRIKILKAKDKKVSFENIRDFKTVCPINKIFIKKR